MYEVLLEKRAQHDIRTLPAELQERIVGAIGKLEQEPRPAGCRKIVGSKNDWRIRVGDYRAIYQIDDRRQQVRVMYVRHGRDAYR